MACEGASAASFEFQDGRLMSSDYQIELVMNKNGSDERNEPVHPSWECEKECALGEGVRRQF